MRCPTCSHENPDSGKFCGECGTNLRGDAPTGALDGAVDEAAPSLGEALQLAERAIGPSWIALLQALVAGLMGHDHPLGSEAGATARAWFREHDFNRWDELLDEFLPSQDAVASETV